MIQHDWATIADYTSWRIGGRVRYLLEPESLGDLMQWRADHQGVKLMMLGLGSNVLFDDADMDIAVVLSRSFLADLKQIDTNKWCVEAGVTCSKLARVASSKGCADAAFFCGIPGTVGGALHMNAGAFGGETWQHVDWVDMLTRDGQVRRFEASEFNVDYRRVIPPETGYYVRSQMVFNDVHASSQQHQIAKLLAHRALSQPIGLPSCGSVFKNPYPQHAGELIESCGLKGFGIGGAEVSNKHANFIINKGGARASDVVALMNYIRNMVHEIHGIALRSEVIYIHADGSLTQD